MRSASDSMQYAVLVVDGDGKIVSGQCFVNRGPACVVYEKLKLDEGCTHTIGFVEMSLIVCRRKV